MRSPPVDGLSVHLDPGQLFASLVVSTIGFGLFLYGKKQARLPQLLVGLALMVLPSLVPSSGWTWALGGVGLAGVWGATQAGL